MDNLNLTEARKQMINAYIALENANEYLAKAFQNTGIDYGTRHLNNQIKKKLAGLMETLANIISDKETLGEL